MGLDIRNLLLLCSHPTLVVVAGSDRLHSRRRATVARLAARQLPGARSHPGQGQRGGLQERLSLAARLCRQTAQVATRRRRAHRHRREPPAPADWLREAGLC